MGTNQNILTQIVKQIMERIPAEEEAEKLLDTFRKGKALHITVVSECAHGLDIRAGLVWWAEPADPKDIALLEKLVT
jgi:hypothetical protein